MAANRCLLRKGEAVSLHDLFTCLNLADAESPLFCFDTARIKFTTAPRSRLVYPSPRFQHQKPDNTNSFERDKETEKLTS
jgi:hypothetical protein